MRANFVVIDNQHEGLHLKRNDGAVMYSARELVGV
jgi:hypothetical protein